MPTYNFRHRETGEITEKFFSLSLREEYLKDNPHLESVLLGAPSIGDPIRLGIRKPDDGFREVLAKAKEAHPRGNVNTF
jgi:hypothetical protein